MRAYPNEVVIQAGQTGLDVTSTVRLDQIRAVDRQRLIKRLGRLNTMTMRQVDLAIEASLGLFDL